jgi:hypothetical protein
MNDMEAIRDGWSQKAVGIKPRNYSYPGAQGVMSSEGSRAIRVEVEWLAQPAGCSTPLMPCLEGPLR